MAISWDTWPSTLGKSSDEVILLWYHRNIGGILGVLGIYSWELWEYWFMGI
jgi:hypothetical protein